MSDVRLSQDAESLLRELYNAYRARRKDGMTSDKAKRFGGSQTIQAEYMQQWPTNDIDEAARELARQKLAVCGWGNNALSACILLPEAIAYMESKPGLLGKALDVAGKIKGAVPFA